MKMTLKALSIEGILSRLRIRH